MSCEYYQRTYKYVFVPVWIFNYHYGKKTFDCIVNGRSGRVVGKYPKSFVKIGTIALTILAVTGLVVWLFVKYFV